MGRDYKNGEMFMLVDIKPIWYKPWTWFRKKKIPVKIGSFTNIDIQVKRDNFPEYPVPKSTAIPIIRGTIKAKFF